MGIYKRTPVGKRKPGWFYEPVRHSLAARGLTTKGRKQSDIQHLIFEADKQKKELLDARRKNKLNIRILDQYLWWLRKGKGIGSLYSRNDVDRARSEILRSNDQWSIDRANDVFNSIQAYERSGFVPTRQFTKLERAFVRANQKQFTGTKLTPLEIKGLKKHGGIYRPKPKVRRVQTLEDFEKLEGLKEETVKRERVRR
jgi:hypothetical protein